jgi:phosphatidate cytidylyltransferase
MNNLNKRLSTGILLAVIILRTITFGSYGLLIIMLILDFLGLLEFYRIFRSEKLIPRGALGMVLGTMVISAIYLVASDVSDFRIFLVIIPVCFSIFLLELFLKAENPFLNIAITLLGVVCISIPFGLFLWLAFLPWGSAVYHAKMMIGLFIILWSADAGAYLFGKSLGKRHLFPRISPNKTWEGSAGGAVCAFLGSYVIYRLFHSFPLNFWLSIAAIILIFGTFGDLIKSLMKRSLHIKDTGTILPGHGGILDRFDTLLGSAPFIFIYLILTEHA